MLRIPYRHFRRRAFRRELPERRETPRVVVFLETRDQPAREIDDLSVGTLEHDACLAMFEAVMRFDCCTRAVIGERENMGVATRRAENCSQRLAERRLPENFDRPSRQAAGIAPLHHVVGVLGEQPVEIAQPPFGVQIFDQLARLRVGRHALHERQSDGSLCHLAGPAATSGRVRHALP